MPNPTDIELLQPGDTILNGQYTIEKHLGSGGQGQVYLARHRIFDQVAVKRLHPHIAAQAEGLTRFERELRITHQLRGEHVILIHNFDRDLVRDEWFSVMEYANGGSLQDRLATEAPLSVTEAIQLAITLCQALAHIHQYPYVHGDLKPSNVLFHARSNQESILQLSDFGSAFQPVQAGVLPLPSGLKEARTHLYVSPELLDANDPEDKEALTVGVDQRADIYAIGMILYEMLTGRPPFWEPSGESEDMMVLLEQRHALFQKVKYQVPSEPKKQRSEILLSLNNLVMKALAKKPAERFANVGEMQARLEEILQEEKSRLAELDRLHPLADQAFREEKWGEASDLLYKILNLDPDDQDAIEKRRVVEDQRSLMSLRLQIPRAMNDEQWEEARELVQEALAIAPEDAALKTNQEKIANQLTVVEILSRANEAERQENWREVIDLCLEAFRLDPSHAEASRLLSHAQRQLQIATLRQQIEMLRKKGDKPAELEKLTELQELVSTDAQVKDRINVLRNTIKLETCYAEGKKAYDEERWETAVDALGKVTDLDPFYHDAASMLFYAQKRLAQDLEVKHDTERRQELRKLFEEGEELIRKKQWQAAWEIFKKICKDKNYPDVTSDEELFACLYGILGHQCAEAQEWYLAKRYFAKALEYAPNHPDASQHFARARDNNRLKRNYRIKRTLGPGGTSQVDYAEDMNRGQREVSLKYLNPSYVIEQGDDISQRFRRQAQRCIGLDHPNIVKTLAVEMRGVVEDKKDSQEADVPVVVMEYIEGQNLAKFLEENRRVSESQAISITRQLCLALQYAHERQLLHLDIKPSNILIQADGLIKLTDFAHTSHGTRGYRSPEQVHSLTELDARADVFAVGKVLYALLTGKSPIEDPLDEEDLDFRKIIPQLQNVIRKAAAPDRKDRYQSAQAMFDALQKVEAEIPMIVLEHSKGQNLAEYLKETRWVSKKQAVDFTRQLCRILIDIHKHSIFHRDINPSNILVGNDGLLQLTYFNRNFYGTRGYRPPEQVRLSVELGEHTDIFATGKLLYALLTGIWPTKDPLDEKDRDFQKIWLPLKKVIYKATAPEPKDRYESAQSMLDALNNLPWWLNFLFQVSDVWPKVVAFVKTWKWALAIVGALLTFIILPLATAEDNTPLGRMRNEFIESISGITSRSSTARYIGNIETLVGDSLIESGFYNAAAGEEVHIKVRAVDTNGEYIPDDEVRCRWEFNASPQAEEQCTIIYHISPDQIRQSVDVFVEGKEPEKILNRAEDTVYFFLQSVEENPE
jgi:serine/threonine protein kinase